MLYLVKSYFPMGKFIYKVGFSEDSNIKIRLDKYFYTSPGSEVISLRQGDEMLEDLIHYYLYYLGYRYQKNGRLDEWFIGNSEVLSIFHISRESLERKIWKHRDKIFDKDKVKSKTSLDYKLFKYLYLKNKDSFIGVLIDLDKFKKPFRTKAKLVDSIFWGIYSKDLQLETKLKYLSNWIPSGDYEIILQNFIYEFEETNRFSEKLQIYCEYLDYYKDIKIVFDNIRTFVKEPEYQKYYDFYGTSGCKAKEFRRKDLEKDFINNMKNDSELIYKEFNIGEMYTSKNIKNRLGIIYASLGISKTPKATDLGKYFEVKSVLIPNPETEKRDKGFKIISKKI